MRSILFGAMSALVVLFLAAVVSRAAADKPDPYTVPEGTTQDYVDFLLKLTKVKPASAEESNKMRAAMIKASDNILAGNPDEQQSALAVSAKSQAIGDDLNKLAEFTAELKKAGRDKLARNVRGFALAIKVKVVPPTKETFKDRATEIIDFLTEGPVDAGAIQLAQLAGRMAEISGDSQFAAETYQTLEKLFLASDDPRAVKYANIILKRTVRRVSLVGNPMTLEGNIIGGGPVDLSKYKGKVVLVNFFATWCRPCRAEIENLKKLYPIYHDKGFEIIGVGCDRDKASLDTFIKNKDLPWPVIYGEKGPSPTAAYYGINSYPQLFLIGKDGNVISLNARGKTLLDELKKQLGPAS